MRISWLLAPAAAAGVVLLTGCIGGPPSPDRVAAEFATPIEPAWSTEVPGLMGELVVRDGVVVAYAADDEVGMRLTAHDLESGDLLWEHTASPGGAISNPFLSSYDSVARPYPIPAITPVVVDGADEESAAVVYFERDVETDSIRPDDYLRVVDLRTGEPLEIAVTGIDPEDRFLPLRTTEAGDVVANVYSPGFPCRDGLTCFVAAHPDDFDAYGVVVLDPVALEVTYDAGFVPPRESLELEWGLEFARVLTDDDTRVARIVDGETLWEISTNDLFDDSRTTPPEYVPFRAVGDLVLVQGYQSILESFADDTHTLSLDFAASRTLVALDAETGEVAWRAPGVDMLCLAVAGRPTPADAEHIPACVAEGGSFVFDMVAQDFVDEVPVEASVGTLDLADGSVDEEQPGLGVESLANLARLSEVVFAATGPLSVATGPDGPVLIDLDTMEVFPMPEDAAYVCRSERPDVDPEFEGSTFAGGINPITTGYPAGWAAFPCDATGAPGDTWSRGAVRVAGLTDADATHVVIAGTDELTGFSLG